MKKNKIIMAPPYPIRLEASIYLKLRSLAKSESRSMNKQMELAIKKMICDYENKNGEIIINLDDLDE